MAGKEKSKLKMDLKLVKLINLCLEKNIPFVSFRLPDEDSIKTWIQLSGKFNLFESLREVGNKSGFVYAPFHRRTNFPVIFFEPELIIENDNFEDSLIEEISLKIPLYPDYNFELPYETSKKEYQKQAGAFIHLFDKNFTKAVLSRVRIVKKPGYFDTGKFFIHLQEKYQNAFCHLINIPGTGTWAGASPETLLKIEKQKVQTVSLAGTQQKIVGKKEILWKVKEMEEQRYVSNYIIDVLKQFNIKDFQIEGPQTIQAGKAIHLSTKFCFDESYIQNRLADFIEYLHPTPAVCGLPREKALDLILLTEKHNREYYSGFCGLINMEEKIDLFVNLRCMKILKESFALFVGGGLTGKSVPEKEWEETELKAETLLSLI
jgi:isochorismate synthase